MISGHEESRPEWDRLFLDAHKKRFDVILFRDLSRFSRSGTLYTLQKLKELENLGIGYISYQEPYLNSVGQFRDVVISVLATAAKIECEKISERTKAALYRLEKNGVSLGRPEIPRETLTLVANLLRQGFRYSEIRRQAKYRTKDGKLRHVSLGKICEIKKGLSEKEGVFSG